MPAIELKRTPEGRLVARRLDGRPLTAADRREASRLAMAMKPGKTLDPTDGTIQAVLIASKVLGADVWLILKAGWIPNDGNAVFYPDELQWLRTKTPEQLKEIHKIKLTFPGCRVKQ